MTENTKPAIQVNALEKSFGNIHAVRGITFSVDHGEVLGFLGPNGAGKSTTMKIITGYLEATGGSVMVNDFNVDDDPIAVKSNIGYLPEGAPSYGEMTVNNFLKFVADIRGLEGKDKVERIKKVVDEIHLNSVLEQTIETLSKGYKRRVGIAQAIMHDPDVLIMDEPTDGLDPNQKHEVRSLIKKMAKDKAIVISTHILEEVDAVCTRAIIIASGQKLFDGTPTELRTRSKDDDIEEAFRLITTEFYSEQGSEAQS